MTKRMKNILIFWGILLCWPISGHTVEVQHQMKTSIGLFDAVENVFTYALKNGRDYDIKTLVKTSGMFGTLYPFNATYHAVGTYSGLVFKPQDYFYKTRSTFNQRTKEIFYQDGIPQYRVSVKNGKKRKVNITTDPNYSSSIDLLSVFGVLVQKIYKSEKCDLEQYSFNGKRYSKSLVKTVGKEKIDTGYFKGKALKCQYSLEVVEDTDAGFFLNDEEPIYFWVLKDEKTKAYFVAKIAIESTPFGKLEALTTKIEVKE